MLFISSISLFSQKPGVKFYLNDGKSKSYNIEDVSNLSFIPSINKVIMMTIYLKDLPADTYPISEIDSINFESLDGSFSDLYIYKSNQSYQNYVLNEIDSIIFKQAVSANITSITPATARIGETIKISGNGFGSTRDNGFVSFMGSKGREYSDWNDTEISVKVPSGAATGKLSVTVNNIKSNEVDFTLNSTPIITNIDPASFESGSIVTINGFGFGATKDASLVIFGSAPASEYPSWSDTQIKVKVPTSAVSGKLSVKVNSINSNLVDYTIAVTPKITSIAPTSFAIGSTVTINGTNFGATRGTSNVSFNGINATTFTSWSNTKIVCKVPTGVTTGLLSVTVNAVTSNEVLFTIVTPIETVLIPAGTFKMGNTGPYSGIIMIQEVPVHNVTISRDFYMSKYEIIQELYLSLVGTNPSNLKRPDHPVERINWFDAVAFCNKLSDRDGYTKCYKINGSNVTCDWDANGWRLPTEAEWEYACKAGTSTDFYNGNNESDLDQIAWHSGNSGDSTHVPGLKKPNKFGLYDILGNVFEWVWDWSGNYSGGAETDPTGSSSGAIKLCRGGSWHNGMPNGMSRSSFRGWMDTPYLYSSTMGIRVVRLAN